MTMDTREALLSALKAATDSAWEEYYLVVKPAGRARREAEERASYEYDAVREPAWRKCSESLDAAIKDFKDGAERAKKEGRW